MQPRIFHGDLTTEQVAQALIAAFNRGNYRAQQLGSGKQIVVQIATRQVPSSGGQTALSVTLQQLADGVSVVIGQQNWFGVAASLGMTAFSAFRNPFALLGRLDDLAQDIESLSLHEQVWKVITQLARQAGASQELALRLRRMVCPYCNVPNEMGEDRCIACGAPLGNVQPRACMNCGFIVTAGESTCPNCKQPLA